jgi:hypothetical protein
MVNPLFFARSFFTAFLPLFNAGTKKNGCQNIRFVSPINWTNSSIMPTRICFLAYLDGLMFRCVELSLNMPFNAPEALYAGYIPIIGKRSTE